MLLTLLLTTPVLFSVLLFFCRGATGKKIFPYLVRLGAVAVIGVSIWFCAAHFDRVLVVDLSGFTGSKYIILLLEALMAAYLIYIGIRRRAWSLLALSVLHILLVGGFELKHDGHARESLYVDKLSLLLIIIIGVIGGIICIYATEYMKDYHRNHPDITDRRPFFFAVLFLFLSAMFGIVISNDLGLLLFFWEITSLSSFLLIGYTKTPEARQNALTAITVNELGGLFFIVGIILLAAFAHVTDFNSLLDAELTPITQIGVFLIACAALTKSAQFPFSQWLLGAMVAPTPTSAMLHSSTMVKAGVYVLLRLSPLLGNNAAGISVTMVGGITFFTAALMAVSQMDAKRVLAYSTISNLGLIVACAGIDTAESLWAAIMLILFHAIAKSLLFLSVGSIEHLLGTRSLEAMDGLVHLSKTLTMMLVIGIAGMFVAPFGMLISKWAAMKAFLDSENIFIVLLVAFGSSATLFFWTKWMGKLIANADRTPPTSYRMRGDERVSLYTLAAMVIAVCLAHPLISLWFVEPYIHENVHVNFVSPINAAASAIIILMLCFVFILPVILMPIYKRHAVKPSLVYLSGENTGDDESFYAAGGAVHRIELRNWYMTALFGEHVLFKKSVWIGAGILFVGLCSLIGDFVR